MKKITVTETFAQLKYFSVCFCAGPGLCHVMERGQFLHAVYLYLYQDLSD